MSIAAEGPPVVDAVYFAKCGPNVKVGFSSDVPGRLKSLSTSSPAPIELLGVVPGDFTIERAIHLRLASVRLSGEWFADCDEVRAVLSDIQRRGVEVLGEFYVPVRRAPRSNLPPSPALTIDPLAAAVELYSQLHERVHPSWVADTRRAEKESGAEPGSALRLKFPNATNFEWQKYLDLLKESARVLEVIIGPNEFQTPTDVEMRHRTGAVIAALDELERMMAEVIGDEEVRIARRAFECALQNALRGNFRSS